MGPPCSGLWLVVACSRWRPGRRGTGHCSQVLGEVLLGPDVDILWSSIPLHYSHASGEGGMIISNWMFKYTHSLHILTHSGINLYWSVWWGCGAGGLEPALAPHPTTPDTTESIS
jgi:hypothetical protein